MFKNNEVHEYFRGIHLLNVDDIVIDVLGATTSKHY